MILDNKTKIKKIYVDYDCTIVNSIKAICDMYNEDYQYYKDYQHINWTDINTWDFLECKCAKPEHINTYFNTPRFYEKITYMDNAELVLGLLSTHFEIIIVSMGYSPNLKGKELWIKKHLPYARFIGVNYKEYSDKSHIDMSDGVYIDDSAKNLNTNAQENICFGSVYQWNKDWKYKRCYDWAELGLYICDKYNYEEEGDE